MSAAFTSGFRSMPPVTKNLIIINLIVWVAEMISPGFGQTIVERLGLHFAYSSAFNPAQPISYMFVHDPHSFAHIFFNMFTLYMFGPLLERVWGSARFMLFYFICGIGAGIAQEAVWALTWSHDYISAIAPLNGMTYDSMKTAIDSAISSGDAGVLAGMAQYRSSLVTIGASGAIFGLLLGFAFVFPNMPLYIFFIPIPIKAKYMVLGYAVLEFFFGISGTMGTVAHFAHLGGMLFALIPLLIWYKKGTLRGNNFF